MTYLDAVAPEDFVSLTMHVRRDRYLTFITATFGLPVREQADIVGKVGTAMAELEPQVRAAMAEHPGFNEIGKRMLLSWKEGLAGLRNKRTYTLSEMALGEAFTGFSDSPSVKKERPIIGRSDLLGKR